MDFRKISSLLSISAKAGKTVSGEGSVLKNIRDGRAALVIISREASDRTEKTFRDKCSFYHVPVYSWGTKEELGRFLGKDKRTVACVTDKDLGDGIARLLEMEDIEVPREDD